MRLFSVSIAALITACLPLVLAAEDSAYFDVSLPFNLGAVIVEEMPAPGHSVQSARLDMGMISGFATRLAVLPEEAGIDRVGIEKLFLEIVSDRLGPMNGLRVYTDRLGIVERFQQGMAITTDEWVAGSRMGSAAHAATGSIPGGGAFASAKRMSLQLRHKDTSAPSTGDAAVPIEGMRLHGQIHKIRLVQGVVEELLPELLIDGALIGDLTTDLGVTLAITDHAVKLSGALGLHLDGQSALRLSAQLETDSRDPFVQRISGVVKVDHPDLPEGNVIPDDLRTTQELAAALSTRLAMIGDDVVLASALSTALRQYAAQAESSEVHLHLIDPQDLRPNVTLSDIERLSQFLAEIGFLRSSQSF